MTENTLIRVNGLKKHFPVEVGVFSSSSEVVRAVDGIDLEIMKGETFGLVGETGSGKSTVGHLILRLIEPTEGKIFFENSELSHLGKNQMRKIRRGMGVIFQDPFASLNPRRKIGQILELPLKLHTDLDGRERKKRVHEILDKVELRPASRMMELYPREFSGGQRQRIAIARAIILNPKFIVADEPVTALDMSIQGQILNLMKDLEKTSNLTSLFIAHNLVVVRYMCDRILVMYSGKPMESAPNKQIFEFPAHPYTKALISAIPVVNAKKGEEKIRVRLTGEMPSPITPPSGCRFHTRCPYVEPICRKEEPEWKKIDNDHLVACHLYS